ncbi:MAG: amidohydrolase [Chloroflexi bacterium]|jgi:cytosine/adenosine deaminase-related metal-dependent hydrolase|nr:amidohydrolase [Chloroflexota bacterium]MBL16372.1 amidohydrolase [Chloroflexota bacterium]MDP6497562.1 amidohydrolase family protein [Dehalococcoidia bacterium]MQG11861.1 amidohydrolase family protein [SAR202 cluster bacterium]MQG54654.1 amidohydrolase family protein [SAR202 cluster bacterium]|tara:strand:- start:28151 stop:29530 length:1380 start_codon:yes stop_codon:yes gene_type:complete
MPDATVKFEGARFIITMDPTRRIIADGSLVIQGQRILQVGKAAELAQVQADRVIDATDMVITPGFCNGHMHISYAHATRGIFPDDLGSAYLPNVFKLQAIMTEEEEYNTSLLAITELLKYGTTTFMDPGSTKYLDRCLDAYKQTGCRIITGTHVTDKPNPLGLPTYSTAEAIEIVETTIKHFDGQADGRISAWAMPFAPSMCSDELLLECKRLADHYGTGMTLHYNNGENYIEASVKETGLRPTQHLEKLGVLGNNVTLAHMLGQDESEVETLARTETRAVVVPTAAVKGGAGMTQTGLLPEMLDAGMAVGLATDAGNNSNLLETNRAMYLIAVLYKDARQDSKAIPAETALEMATIMGAEALGLADDIGSLEAGKKADLVLFDTRRAEWQTLFNPVNNLVYNADGRSVHMVVVDGQIVVEDHKPLFVDEWALAQKVQGIGEDMLGRAGLSFPPRWPIV